MVLSLLLAASPALANTYNYICKPIARSLCGCSRQASLHQWPQVWPPHATQYMWPDGFLRVAGPHDGPFG